MYFQLRTHFKSRVGASLWLGWGTRQRVALPLMAQRRHVCVTTSSLADRHTKAESSWFPSGALLTSRMLMASILLDVGGSPSWHLRVTYCLFHLLLLTSVHIHANLVSTLFFQRWLLFLSLPVHNLLKPERFNSVLQGLQYEIHILPGQGTPADAALGYSVLPSQVKKGLFFGLEPLLGTWGLQPFWKSVLCFEHQLHRQEQLSHSKQRGGTVRKVAEKDLCGLQPGRVLCQDWKHQRGSRTVYRCASTESLPWGGKEGRCKTTQRTLFIRLQPAC